MMEEIEQWRDIPEYEGLYQVSDLGRVRRVTSIRGASPGILTLHTTAQGYKYVHLSRPNRTRKVCRVHRLVLTAFVGLPPDYRSEANHLNGIPSDNRPANLEWTSRAENERHAFEVLCRQPRRGEAINGARLTADHVRDIRRLYASECYTATALADMYGVAISTISRVLTGKAWTHVT